MLKRVIIKNFKSFKNETILDLEESKYKILEETNTYNGILKGALFVGPNASGKSNMISAVKLLLDLLFKDKAGLINPSITCLFGKEKSLSFSYEFKFDNDIITYEFKTDQIGNIISETLKDNNKVYLNRLNQNVQIISNNEEIMFDNKKVSKNTLFLKRAFFSSLYVNEPLINKLMNFLQNSIYLNLNDKLVVDYNEKHKIVTEMEEKELEEVNSLLKKLNIKIAIKKSKQEVLARSFVAKSNTPVIFVDRKDLNITLPLDLESLGNSTLINLIPSFICACKTDSLLLVDEFSSAFHNLLEEILISYFMKNSKGSQLIFTSHSTNILDTKLLRPDQIFTIEINKDKGSYITKFSDENPRESQNIEKMYLSGKFGGLPEYNNEI